MKLFIHRGCFDGAVSGALAVWRARSLGEAAFDEIEAVDYSARSGWAQCDLGAGATIVDFLYHPEASVWWDHHDNPFVQPGLQAHYERRRSSTVNWDPKMDSCAGLIARVCSESGLSLPDWLRDTVTWADKIDAARYASPAEAVLHHSDARRIALSLHVDSSPEYHVFLVEELSRWPLSHVAGLERCRIPYAVAAARYVRAIDAMRVAATLVDNIVVYRLESAEDVGDRMIPFFLHEDADYSLGMVPIDNHLKVTANANPWRRPRGAEIGKIFDGVGGGGHTDVGSVLLPSSDRTRADEVMHHVQERLRRRVRE